MFLKIFLISLIVISTQAYSSPFCEGGFPKDSILPPISKQNIIRRGVQKWGESTLRRTLREDELHLLEFFYNNPKIKAQIFRRDSHRFNFSEREIEILSQREINPEFPETVKVNIPQRTQEERELKAQGFNAAYRRGMDEVNEWIAVREQLVKLKADPYLTHVDYFAKKMIEHIAYIERGVTTSSQARNLNHLKKYTKELIDKKQVTYYRWLKFSLSLSKILDNGDPSWYQEGYFDINHIITKDFPNHITIPTTVGEMGIIAMNKGSAHGVYPLGLKTEDSLYFFVHDISHYNPESSSGLIYTRLIEHTKGLPLEKRKNIELAYFVLTHESDNSVRISNPKYVLSNIQQMIYSLLRKNSLIFIQESIVTSFKNSKNSFL